jgi:ABC-2 type transport system ATP-binding protein
MDSPLDVAQVEKAFGGRTVLKGVSFSLEPSEVLGYLGPNGSGKTTTIRIAMGAIRASSGRIRIFGLDSWSQRPDAHRTLGYVSGEPNFDPALTGTETMRFVSELRGEDPGKGFLDELVETLDFDPSHKVGALSRGNRQKLAIILAMMHRPSLLILDEPSTGLDPIAKQSFMTLVRNVTREGGSVLLSSHVLSEVEQIAQRVAIIRDGVLIEVQLIEELRARALHRIVVQFEGPSPVHEILQLPGVCDVEADERRLACGLPRSSLRQLISILSRVEVSDLEVREADLEAHFLQLYRKDDHVR